MSQLLNCSFNRQTMRIPARHIRHLVTGHIAVTDDDILQNLIQGMSQMDIPVRIRWPVMQNKRFTALTVLQHFFIDFAFLPALLKVWLLCR